MIIKFGFKYFPWEQTSQFDPAFFCLSNAKANFRPQKVLFSAGIGSPQRYCRQIYVFCFLRERGVYQLNMIIYAWEPTFNVTIRKEESVSNRGRLSQFVDEDKELTQVNVPARR